ncbi:hypothetical protein F4677DRAFT_133205 [Hypoxylon crocopeplum]|nr:hypothetical protein F4677DRAFT_133205 [Hypoxylon crocopeplum]
MGSIGDNTATVNGATVDGNTIVESTAVESTAAESTTFGSTTVHGAGDGNSGSNSGSNGTGTLYFAYGSNLSPTQMHERCPLSTPVGLARLPGWIWLINKRGYANIVPQDVASSSSTSSGPYSTVPITIASSPPSLLSKKEKRKEKKKGKECEEGVYGLLYRLHPEDEKTLDRCEGVPWAYERIFLDVIPVSPPAVATMAADHGKQDAFQQNDEKKISTVEILAYVDRKRVVPGNPKDEYVDRMNRGIDEAMEQWGLPQAYVDTAMRPFIPADEWVAEDMEEGW